MSQSTPTFTRIDFKKAGLPEYGNAKCYASIIDNAFTAAECRKLLEDTEREHEWQQAGINKNGDGQQHMDVGYRNSGRILRDDPDCAAYILDRIKPFIEDVTLLDSTDPGTAAVLGRSFRGIKTKKKYKLTRLNERLRFLKYTEGQFFRPHCDGQYTGPDVNETSYLTIQLYLNDSTSGAEVEGGATRFWSARKDRFFDVEPKMGRVLVFQHHMLIHSGERVKSGTVTKLITT